MPTIHDLTLLNRVWNEQSCVQQLRSVGSCMLQKNVAYNNVAFNFVARKIVACNIVAFNNVESCMVGISLTRVNTLSYQIAE